MPSVTEHPLSVKLRPWLAEELLEEFEARGESVSEGLRRALEEWWASRHLFGIEFRDGPTGRRAALEDGPEVWEVIAVWRDADGDLERLREHFAWLDEDALEAALVYRDRFPERVEEVLAENERVGRYLAERLE